MALTEIQKDWMTKDVLYTNLRSIATELDNNFMHLSNKLEWLNLVSGPDLTDVGVPSETQTLLANFRTALNNLTSYYDTNFASIADQVRKL